MMDPHRWMDWGKAWCFGLQVFGVLLIAALLCAL
jgi:hypothetical protein